MALHVDDSGARERGVDQSHVQEIGGHLVDDALRIAAITPQRARDNRVPCPGSGVAPASLLTPRGLERAECACPRSAAPRHRIPAGCEARICSVSEVPDRGMPTMKTGSSEAVARAIAAARMKRASKLLDDPVDARGQLRRVVRRAVALAQLVGLSILAEGLVVLLDVVEVLAERVAQADLVPQRQRLGQQAPRRPAASAVSSRVILRWVGDAAISERKLRIDRDQRAGTSSCASANWPRSACSSPSSDSAAT